MSGGASGDRPVPRASRQARWVAFGPDKRERADLLRAAASLSQQELAVRCFMRRRQISAFECGASAPDLPAHRWRVEAVEG